MSNDVVPIRPPSKIVGFLKALTILPVLAILAVLLLPTVFYTVGPGEDAVVLRLGKYHRTEGPGAHMKLPLNFEEVIKIPVRKILNLEFGFRTVQAGVRTQYEENTNRLNESLMLTGDLNVLEVEWIVQYQIADAKNYLYGVVNVNQNLYDISLAVMREVVGDRSVNEVLTTGRTEIETEAQDKMQAILDTYKMGIKLVTLKIQDVNPPDSVKPSFDEANSAKQDAEKIANEAWREYNRVIPLAKGQASQAIADAQAYQADIVNRAQGDATRFLSFYEEFKKAPAVTRERLYFEKMKKIIENAKSVYVVDPAVKGIVPLMNLSGGEK
jgi:membrane protease subunit HflK